MHRHWSGTINLAIIAVTLLAFLIGGHFAATALIDTQKTRQLEELGGVALRRAETAIDFAVETLDDLSSQGPVSCQASSMQSVRLHVYQRGAVKDIRVVDRDGAVTCSAYQETLEFDEEWVTRSQMLPAEDPAFRLFRVRQFFGTAMGVMKDTGPKDGLIAIVGVNGFLFDIMPAELQAHSSVSLELANGQAIASATGAAEQLSDDDFALTVTSQRYPFHAMVRVEDATLRQWQAQPYWPIMTLAAFLGVSFGVLLARSIRKLDDPVAEIDRAIANAEFHPYFQPIFQLEGGDIIGAEMLARWVRGDGTVVPPSRFIEAAEDSGRIGAITWQLLRRALAGLRPLFERDARFKLSINIAPRQFVAPGFVADLQRVVGEAGADPSRITLELTEREAFADLEGAAAVVREVRARGFHVAIDDVGIGHSGLSQIQKLGADVIKIDKFFIDCINLDPTAMAVVDMLTRLASRTGMNVVAEGIETAEQAAALKACGVPFGQGYLVSAPVPLGSLLDMMRPARRRQTGNLALTV